MWGKSGEVGETWERRDKTRDDVEKSGMLGHERRGN
jgi:hypothetical protein